MISKNNKRIDVIVKYFHPVAAGIETNILNTYSILTDLGWEVWIHTSKNTHTEKNILPEYEEIRGLKVRRYTYHWYGFINKTNWSESSLLCLHNFNIFPHSYILLVSAVRKFFGNKSLRIILTPHGGYTPEWKVFGLGSRIIKKFYHLTIGKFLINISVDKIRAVSVWEKEQMIKQGIRKDIIRVISNGLEDEAFMDVEKLASKKIKALVPSLGKYIIQVGRIYPIKNYETVLRALPHIIENVKYVIVGANSEDPKYFTSLKNLIKSLNLQHRVIFTGVVWGIDKFYLINKSQMMVHMAKWESFCNAVHEGMSQGRVCIVADSTALPYLIKNGKNGYLVGTIDHLSLAEKINYVLKNIYSNKIKAIQNTNKKESMNHTWKRVANDMNNLFTSIVV